MSELEAVFCEKKESLFITALKIVKNPEDAEEAVQDGFVKAWKCLGGFKGNSQLSTWVHKIVIRAALMKLRAKSCGPMAPHRRDIPVQDEEGVEYLDQFVSSAPNAYQLCQAKEIGHEINKAIEELPTVLKHAFILFYLGGCSMQEGADILGIPMGTFKARIFRARRTVRITLIERFVANG